jgi:hypothetical protein
MKSFGLQAILTASCACAAASGAYAGESATLLAGAETYNLKVSVYADAGCAIDQTALTAMAQRQFGRAPRLRAVAEQSIPDIMLTVTVDITAIPPSELPEMCVYNVNARAIHPMVGKLRYSDKTRVIQAMTFNKSMFSAIVPSKVQAAVETQSGKVLGMFFDEYALGNPYP